MSLIILLIVVLVVAGLLVYAVSLAPFGQPFKWVVQALICVVAALVILSRTGLV